MTTPDLFQLADQCNEAMATARAAYRLTESPELTPADVAVILPILADTLPPRTATETRAKISESMKRYRAEQRAQSAQTDGAEPETSQAPLPASHAVNGTHAPETPVSCKPPALVGESIPAPAVPRRDEADIEAGREQMLARAAHARAAKQAAKSIEAPPATRRIEKRPAESLSHAPFVWSAVRDALRAASTGGVLVSEEEWDANRNERLPTMAGILKGMGWRYKSEIAQRCGLRMSKDVTE